MFLYIVILVYNEHNEGGEAVTLPFPTIIHDSRKVGRNVGVVMYITTIGVVNLVPSNN